MIKYLFFFGRGRVEEEPERECIAVVVDDVAAMAIVDGAIFSRTINPDTHLRDSALSTDACETYINREYYWGNKNLHYYQFGGASDVNTQKPFSATGMV